MKTIFWLVAVSTLGLAAQDAERVVEKIRLNPAIAPAVRPAVTAATATAAAKPASSTPADTLEFVNGDVLRGTFLAIDPEQGVRWRHDAIREPISVIPGKIRNVRLLLQRPAAAAKSGNCKVTLGNGDSLAGTLISLDDQALMLETWYAGTLTLPRPALRMLMVTLARGEVLYQGPTGMDGWTVTSGNRAVILNEAVAADVVVAGGLVERVARGGEGEAASWSYKDEAFHATTSGCLGNDLKLPPSSSIEFDLECASYPQLAVHFYTDAIDKSYGNSAYILQFSSRTIYLRRSTRPGTTRSLGTVESPIGLGGKPKGRVAIRTDTQKQSVAVFVDEVLIKKWTDIGAGALGTGLMFYQQGSNPTKISNIRVTRWDGRLDDPASAVGEAKEDLLVLSNQDKISGHLASIKDGTLDFKTSFSQLQIPLERVSFLQFAGGKPDGAAPAGAARLSFRDFGRLTLKIERWNEQSVEGESPVFGKAKLNPAAFNGIAFTFAP